MTRDAFIMKTDIKALLEERFGVQKKWDEWSRLNAFDVLLEQTPTIANIVYWKEEKDMYVKCKACLDCTRIESDYCRYCFEGSMAKPKVDYGNMSRSIKGDRICSPQVSPSRSYHTPPIRNVIFSGRATIVFWEDNTKTVVKCDKEDVYDPHTGLAEAIAKKALGDDYRRLFRKYIKQYNKQKEKEAEVEKMGEENANLLARLAVDIVDTISEVKRMRGVID